MQANGVRCHLLVVGHNSCGEARFDGTQYNAEIFSKLREHGPRLESVDLDNVRVVSARLRAADGTHVDKCRQLHLYVRRALAVSGVREEAFSDVGLHVWRDVVLIR